MANRDVFYIDENNQVKKINVNFKWVSGFSKPQMQQSVTNLHQQFMSQFPKAKILEASTVSTNKVGVAASAFNLTLKSSHGTYKIEQLFQAGKTFKNAGSQIESLSLIPRDAKRKSRELNKSDSLVGFNLFDLKFPLEPKTVFYDWLYINGMLENINVAKAIYNYNAFSDINAKPGYTINSQARSCAIFVSLLKEFNDIDRVKNLLKYSHLDDFIKVVYQTK